KSGGNGDPVTNETGMHHGQQYSAMRRLPTVPVMLAGFAAFVGLYATQPLLPLLARVFRASSFEVSLTITAPPIAVALAAPAIGRWFAAEARGVAGDRHAVQQSTSRRHVCDRVLRAVHAGGDVHVCDVSPRRAAVPFEHGGARLAVRRVPGRRGRDAVRRPMD